MKRHACMLDLLRPENNDDDLLDQYLSRSEYTDEDFQKIYEVAYRIQEAVKRRNRRVLGIDVQSETP